MEKVIETENGATITMKYENDTLEIQHSEHNEDFESLEDFLVTTPTTQDENEAIFNFCENEAKIDQNTLWSIVNNVNERRQEEHNKQMCRLLVSDFLNYAKENSEDSSTLWDEEGQKNLIEGFIKEAFARPEPNTSTPEETTDTNDGESEDESSEDENSSE